MNRIRFSSLLAGLILAALFFSGFGERQARAVGEKTAGTGSAPTCSQFKLYAPTSLTISGKPRIRFWIKNTSAQGTFVQRIVFNWNTYRAINPSQVLRRWRYDDLTNPFDFNIRYSPYSWSKLPGVTGFNTDLLSGEADAFLFDFLNYDSGWPANIPATAFGLKVTLGNGCILAFRPQATATPTKTGTITKTPAISHTPTATPTPTRTQTTKTPTNTTTPTRTPLISSTPTLTPTITKTRTITPTYIPTITSTPTPRCIDC